MGGAGSLLPFPGTQTGARAAGERAWWAGSERAPEGHGSGGLWALAECRTRSWTGLSRRHKRKAPAPPAGRRPQRRFCLCWGRMRHSAPATPELP